MKTVSYREFFEDVPLYQEVTISELKNAASISRGTERYPERIELVCARCNSSQPHLSAQRSGDEPGSNTRTYYSSPGLRACTPHPIQSIQQGEMGAGPTINYNEGQGFFFYQCAACGLEVSTAVVYSGPKFVKLGVWPSQRPTPPAAVKRYLGEKYVHLYKNGLACERHNFGVGAFAYFRRIVEGIIYKLLEDLSRFVEDDAEKRDAYATALESIKESHSGSEKIAVVKDLLPANLRVGGRNPLGQLYSALSEGIHAQDDETALGQATTIKVVLEILIGRLAQAEREEAALAAALKSLEN